MHCDESAVGGHFNNPAAGAPGAGSRARAGASGLLTDAEEYQAVYDDPEESRWRLLVVPVLYLMERDLVASELHVDRRTLRRWFEGKTVRAHPGTERDATQLAVSFARSELRVNARGARHSDIAVLAALLTAVREIAQPA
jgi:hypothetical protein